MSRERLLAPCSSTSLGVNACSSTNASYYCDAKPVPFKELEKATKKFRSGNLLHKGHFSNLYKGWLHEHALTAANPWTGMAVAVKKYCKQSMTRIDFLDSIDHNYLNQVCHPNLVKLIAYCSDDDNLLLVYEFMSKGCLADHLFKRGNNHSILPWATRIKVAKGTARGLSFLHGLEIPVMYGDFTTANILLDVEFNAKLCGLGFRRDCVTMHHKLRLPLQDTRSIPPELYMTGRASRTCDVYSFGVVLLELLSGRLAYELIRNERPYNKRKILRIVDPDIKGQCSEDEANIIATPVLQCLNDDLEQRPTMDELVIALDQLPHQ